MTSAPSREHREIEPGHLQSGFSLDVPGDKSISQRVALLTAISTGTSVVKNYLRSGDCLNTLHAMEALGATLQFHEDRIEVTGQGHLKPPETFLDFGNSGTGIRLSSGLLAGQAFDSELTGDASLCSRPMKRIQTPLNSMGARIELTEPRGTAPLRICGQSLRGMEYVQPVASAQVKSAILLAGLFAEGTTRVVEPGPSRDHTERLFQALGFPLQVKGPEISLEGFGRRGPTVEARTYEVPGDFSSAAFWLVLASIVGESPTVLRNTGLNPRRTALLEVLKAMGAEFHAEVQDPDAAEPAGHLTVRKGSLQGTVVSGNLIPNLIDEIPVLCVAGAFCSGSLEIRDAAELRVKESDRIQVMVANLRAAGVPVEERPDGMTVHGGADIQSGWTARSFGDHRIAMSMAILAAAAGVSCRIEDTACTETSYPGFWDQLENIGVRNQPISE